MNNPEDQSEQLLKLLRCKKYEQPPPGYFMSFSDHVIARIETEQAPDPSWWTWLVNRFDARPALVCAYGVAVSSLLLMGIRLSQVFEAELAASPAGAGPWLAASPASPILFPEGFTQGNLALAPASSPLSATRLSFYSEPNSGPFVPTGFRVEATSFLLPTR